jgi:hypothetical protein
MNCSGTERTLVIQSSIDAPSPSQDAQLVINYRRAPAGLGQSRWLTLAKPTSGGQSTSFGMIDASALAPPNTTALEFFSPVDLRPTKQRCPTYEDDCGVVSPLVVEVGTSSGPITEVAQGQIAYFNVLPWGAEVAMAQASQRVEPVLCDDLPETWYQAAIRYEYGP